MIPERCRSFCSISPWRVGIGPRSVCVTTIVGISPWRGFRRRKSSVISLSIATSSTRYLCYGMFTAFPSVMIRRTSTITPIDPYGWGRNFRVGPRGFNIGRSPWNFSISFRRITVPSGRRRIYIMWRSLMSIQTVAIRR